jgi:hypothetical protein
MTISEKFVFVMEQRDSLLQATGSYLLTILITLLLYSFWCNEQ